VQITRRHVTAQAGYAMAALLVVLTVAGVLLTTALPVWATFVKREREAELIWRGTQYARAIDLFRQKYGYVFPPDVDTLLKERFLRKKYTDPMMGDSEFQLLYAAQLPGRNIPGNLADPLSQPHNANARGGIIGVVSRSPHSSLGVFNGATRYDEWAFTPQTVYGTRAVGTPLKGGPPPPGALPAAATP
jgi:type II secretory pathway pseudopilin PulG